MNITFRDVLNLFFRFLPQILAFTLLSILMIGIYYFFTKDEYLSESKIMIRLGQEQMGGLSFLNARANVHITRREQEIKNEIEIITSGTVIESVARKILKQGVSPQKLSEIKEYLKDKLEVEAFFDSDTITASFSFPDPHIAQKILELIIEEYTLHHISVFTDKHELSLIGKKREDSRREFEAALASLKKFESENKIYDPKQLFLLVESRETLRQQIVDIESELGYSTNKMGKLETILEAIPRYESFSSVEVLNKHHEQMKRRRDEAEIEKQNLLIRYTPDSRMIKDIDLEIKLLDNLLAASPERIIDQKDDRISNAFQTINPMYLELKSEVSGQKAKLDVLKKKLATLDKELARHSQSAKTYSILTKDVDLTKENYEKYYKNFVESNIRNMVEQSKMTNISIVEDPSLNLDPISPDTRKTLFIGALVVIAGNFFLLFLLVVMDNTVTGPENLKKLVNAPIVASIPNHDGLKNFSLNSSLDAAAHFSKEFQRIYISVSSNHPADKVFLLAKTQFHEGATTIGFLFSVFLAKYHSKKVAFVNFTNNDLFKDLQFTKVDKPFTSAVINDNWSIAFIKDLLNVSVFQANTPSPMMSIDMESNMFSIIDEIKEAFDYVFVGVNPIQDSPEMVYLNKTTDITLLFIEAEKTKIPAIAYNIDLLSQYGFKKINIILNKRRFYIPRFLYRAT